MTVAFFVASLAASAQVQSAVNLHPANPFPFQTDALKQAWINANPKDYVRMGGDKSAIQTFSETTPEFTTQEFDAMLLKVTPPNVITVAEKEAWLAAHPSSPAHNVPASNNLETLSASAVVLSSAAASTTPVFATEADKDAWLAAQNPPAFEGANKEAMINAFISGKPVFVDTGNPAADEINYTIAKQLYIQQNQQVYNYIISN